MSFNKWLANFKRSVARYMAKNPAPPAPEPSPAPPEVSSGSDTLPVSTSPDGGAGEFDGLTFRNSQDCRSWPVTVTISGVYIRGGSVLWTEAAGQRESRKWNEKRGDKIINGECILLIPSRGEAGMFDFLRVGQRDKILSNLKPSHEGQGFFPGWTPVKGERVGFCIATISRDRNHAKMRERSNVIWFNWPRDGV